MKKMTFGSRLKDLRLSRGLSQANLAAQIHLSSSCVNRYELDLREPNIETIGIIADFFDVDYNCLLGRSDSFPSQDELELVQKFRVLDNRGKAAVLNVLEHEYSSLKK